VLVAVDCRDARVGVAVLLRGEELREALVVWGELLAVAAPGGAEKFFFSNLGMSR
jgi:hypothetical protein